jgi:hypothetical protein
MNTILPDIDTPTDVHQALYALRHVIAVADLHNDPRAIFPAMYAIITERVAVHVHAGTLFHVPAFISSLAGAFCTRYLETLRWDMTGTAQDTRAWGAAYAACDGRSALPIQHAMLGLSAHINYDLAIGIAVMIVKLGAVNDPLKLGALKHDHDAVNALLRASVPATLDLLADRYGCPLSRALRAQMPTVTEHVAIGMLGAWRARVWRDAVVMARLPARAAWGHVTARMEATSAHYATAIAARPALPLLQTR